MIVFLVIVGLSLVILVHEVGHFLAAKLSGIKVLEFGFGFPPRLWKRRVGETLISVNALPFGGFVHLSGEDGLPADAGAGSEGGPPPETLAKTGAFAYQTFLKKVGTLAAGVAMNVVFGWLLLLIVFMVGTPQHLMIVDVTPDSPAAAEKIEMGTVILTARSGNTELRDPVASDAFIAFVKSAGERPITLEVKKGSETRTVTLVGRTNPPEGEGPLGVALNEIGIAALPLHRAFIEAAVAAWQTLGAVVAGLWYLLTRVFTAPEVLQSVAGPVGIVDLAVQTGSLGLIYILQLLALISLNLAVLNLIPFPALDGGRIVLVAIERLFGRALPRRLQVAVNAVGFAALIILMVIVTVQDIGKL